MIITETEKSRNPFYVRVIFVIDFEWDIENLINQVSQSLLCQGYLCHGKMGSMNAAERGKSRNPFYVRVIFVIESEKEGLFNE